MDLIDALQSSFINKKENVSREFKPCLLYNDFKENMKISYDINQLLRKCETFDISVAFINKSGLAVLKQTLLELKKQNKKGRIITSTYLGFNQPDMFKELLMFDNISVRIYNGKEGFHSKGYIFKNRNDYRIIIGSSNLTQSALSTNQEWNFSFTSMNNGHYLFL